MAFEDLGGSESSRNSCKNWHVFFGPCKFDAAGRCESRILDQAQELLKIESPIFQLYMFYRVDIPIGMLGAFLRSEWTGEWNSGRP